MSTTETPPSSSLAVRFGVRAALLLIAVFAPIFAVVGVEPAHAGRASLPDVSPGAASATTADVPLVVKVAPGAPAPDFTALGFRVKDAITAHGIYVLEPTRIDRPTAAQGGVTRSTERAEPAGGTFSDLPLSAREAISRLRAVPGVKWAEPAASRRMCLVPNDPFYSPRGQSPGQWYLPQVGLPTAWGVVTGSADVTVAILDTGINKDLPDFVGRVVWPYSAVDKRSDWPYWQDKDGHGTAVAGVALARGNDAVGMAGVAWNVKIMPIKIATYGQTDDIILAQAIYWAVDHGADVINISFGGASYTVLEQEAVNYALSHRVVVVASAGNSGSDGVCYPAALPGVIAVGATDQANARPDFSATGVGLDLVAPGTEIGSYPLDSSTGSWRLWSGTSFSAPIVSGTAALLLSLKPTLTPGEMADILDLSATDLGPSGWDREFGWGLVNAAEAVADVRAATAGTTPPGSLPRRFSDVLPSTPYAAQIEFLAARGIVSGMSDGRFYPEKSVTRQQFAKMLVLTLGYPVSESDRCPFTDVLHTRGDLYPYHYVAVAWLRGITRGTAPKRFSPYNFLSRAQMITMVTRAAQLPDPPPGYVPPFPNFSSVHYPYARRAAYSGLLSGLLGLGPNYNFWRNATRGEVCALLYNLLQ